MTNQTNPLIASHYFIMFSNAEDAPESVSDLFERLIGYAATDPAPCFELARFDDTYIVAVPRVYNIPQLQSLIDEHPEYIRESH